jgi:glutamyl-tRNA reductase
MSMQTTNVGDRRSTSRKVLVDEVILAVHDHAREICEQQLLSARGRLSNEQAHMTRTVVEAIVGRLLAVPEARMNAASEERDYAELLAHLFELEPLLSESGDACGSAGSIGSSSARIWPRPR